MQLFSADAAIFFFANKKMKKPPSKVAQKHSNRHFFPYCQTAQTEEFMFQNVAYRPTAYRTGLKTDELMLVQKYNVW